MIGSCRAVMRYWTGWSGGLYYIDDECVKNGD